MQAVLILACLAVASAIPHFPANGVETSDLLLAEFEEYVPFVSNGVANVERSKRSAEPFFFNFGRNNRRHGYGYGHNHHGYGGGYHNHRHYNHGYGGGYNNYGRRNHGYGHYHGYH